MPFNELDVLPVGGFLNGAEFALLHELASQCPENGVIVELGSYQGKSTLSLAKGAQIANARMWAIDPHPELQVTNDTLYGMHDQVALLRNLLTYEVAHIVRVITMASYEIVKAWTLPIDLLWIDGSHDYEDVKRDLVEWSPHVIGKIAMHDTSGNWPGVSQALSEFVASGEWQIVARADATSVLERVANA